MDYQVIEKGPMLIMGIEVRTTNEDAKAAQDLATLWGRFYKELIPVNISYQKTGEAIGLYCEYEKDHTKPYTVVAGCEVTMAGDLPDGYVLKHVPAAKYAVFEIKGPFPKNLVDTWQWVWHSNLRRTYTGDFELYQIGFDGNENSDIHLYIAIK